DPNRSSSTSKQKSTGGSHGRDIYFFSSSSSSRVDPKMAFLSNFYPSPFVLNGKEYATVEHYYQSQKFAGSSFEETVRCASSPLEAKKLASQQEKAVGDWESRKDEVMLTALRAKFLQN